MNSLISRQTKHGLALFGLCVGVLLCAPVDLRADQVILENLIVDGSTCIGDDCADGESFGSDTLRLKENNPRIRAMDTSITNGFPSSDWQITFNDTTNGGANKFSIDDMDRGRTPFTLVAGAPTHSLYVDSQGDVGLGTSTPNAELHLVSGDTPTLRLEQDGSGGFTPQTWDVGGNETNYFVRDATNISMLPFRIMSGAPTGSIHIAANGDVGLGTTFPSEDLHLAGYDGGTQLLIEDLNSTLADRNLLYLRNNGSPAIGMENSSGGVTWTLMGGTDFVINNTAGENALRLTQAGDLSVLGEIVIDDLNLYGTAGNTQILIEEANGSLADRYLLYLRNNGSPSIGMENTGDGVSWTLTGGTDFVFNNTAGDDVLRLSQTGDLSVMGEITVDDLNLYGTDGNTQILIEEANGSLADRNLLYLRNNGSPSIGMENTADGVSWTLLGGTDFVLNNTAGDDVLRLTQAGDLSVMGEIAIDDLNLYGTDGNTQILIEEASSTLKGRALLSLKNNGPLGIVMANTATGTSWDLIGGNKFIVRNTNDEKVFMLSENGDLKLTGEIIASGTSCGDGCDIVFAPDTKIETIDEHAEAMWTNSYLPAVGPTIENEPFNLTQKTGGMLNELEKAHIYIEQLHHRLNEREAQYNQLVSRLAKLEARL